MIIKALLRVCCEMALEIGLISSVITVAGVAWKSCKALHDLIDGIRETPQQLSYLHTDLKEVGRTLESFADLDRQAAAHENAQYRAALQHSLEQLRPCMEELGTTCDTFRISLNEVFRHSTSDRTSKRDRFSFQFQEGNIQRFRDRMASYKNTLTVALGLASLYVTSELPRTCQLTMHLELRLPRMRRTLEVLKSLLNPHMVI